MIKDTDAERTNAAAEGKKGEEVHVEAESVLGHNIREEKNDSSVVETREGFCVMKQMKAPRKMRGRR